jgi:hypothetical protein
MRKTTITAAALAMSASLAGLAYAAAPDGRSTEDSSVVSTFSPIFDSSSTSSSPISSSAAPTTADDPVGHDVGDGHGNGGHGADDPVATIPTTPTTHQRHDGSDDGPGHDVGDDHGAGGGNGADDGTGHDVGDDHGGGGGSDG